MPPKKKLIHKKTSIIQTETIQYSNPLPDVEEMKKQIKDNHKKFQNFSELKIINEYYTKEKNDIEILKSQFNSVKTILAIVEDSWSKLNLLEKSKWKLDLKGYTDEGKIYYNIFEMLEQLHFFCAYYYYQLALPSSGKEKSGYIKLCAEHFARHREFLSRLEKFVYNKQREKLSQDITQFLSENKSQT